MPSKANIMIVDDEENLLKGMARQLSKKYSLSSAMSGQEALEKVVNIGDLSVIVSDMRMPEMNGIELLKRVEEIAPETIRIMLTGNADQETAIEAINEGNIYRFFTKPCDLEVLSKGIDEGITQYRLNLAEKELIETTLAGSIKLLVDVLDLNYPKIAQQRESVRKWAEKLSGELKISKPWELNLAVMLCDIGLIGIPSQIVAKKMNGFDLTEKEKEVLDCAPQVGGKLVGNIPRLNNVAQGIRFQMLKFGGDEYADNQPKELEIPIIARVLKILNQLSADTGGNEPNTINFQILRAQHGVYDPNLLNDIESILAPENNSACTNEDPRVAAFVPLVSIQEGMILLEDITYDDGHLILSKGYTLTEIHIQRLKGLAKIRPISNPIHVSISEPSGQSKPGNRN